MSIYSAYLVSITPLSPSLLLLAVSGYTFIPSWLAHVGDDIESEAISMVIGYAMWAEWLRCLWFARKIGMLWLVNKALAWYFKGACRTTSRTIDIETGFA